MEALVRIGLGNAAAATGLALVAASVGWLGRRPALTHSLWLVVLLKLLTPPVLIVSLPWPAGWAPPAPEPAVRVPQRSEPPHEREGTAALAVPAGDPTPLPAAAPADPEPLPGTPPGGPVFEPPEAGRAWPLSVAGLWITGSVLWWALAGLRLYHFRWFLGHAAPAPAAVQEQVRRLAGRLGLGRCPGAWFVPAPIPPLLWALAGTPRLLLPAALWQRLTPEQQDTLLAHELAHLRRRDHWVRGLELLVLGLYWWHPLVWWARRELRAAEEQCCDAWVVWALPAAAAAYASALLETAAFLSQSRPALPLAASGAGHVQQLRRRLIMILRGTTPRALSAAGFLAVLGLGAALLPLRPTWAQTEAGPDQPGEQRAIPATPEQAIQPAPDQPTPAAQADAVARKMDRERLATEEKALAEQLAAARDEVELLEVQLRVKEAQAEAAKTSLDHAQQRLKELERIGPVPTAGPITALLDARWEVETRQAQLRVREAEAGEPRLRLKQARRRLARLQRQSQDLEPARRRSARPATPPDQLPSTEPHDNPAEPSSVRREARGASDAGPSREDTRLRELEKKLDTLLREVESLRRELRSRQPTDGLRIDQETDVLLVHDSPFRIAFSKAKMRRPEVIQVLLFSSTDRGQTWRLAAAADPDKGFFAYYAAADGLYWFTFCTVDQKGNRQPADLSRHPPDLKVLVNTRN